MTLRRYIGKRLDGVEGEIPQLLRMLKKSFGAINFRTFWVYWNPIYSYVLTYYVYKPLKRILSQGRARTATFIINGMFHDVIVSILRGKFFYGVTLLFVIYAIIIFIEEKLKISFVKTSYRVLYNLLLLLTPFVSIMVISNK